MAAITVTPDQDAIVCEIEIAAPPERVFEALTDPRQVRAMNVKDSHEITVWGMDLRVGGIWRSTVREKATGREYVHHGEVVEIKPPYLLAHTWFANFHDQPARPTLVRYELKAIPTGTRLKVTHSGLAPEPKAREAYRGGWPGVLAAIKNFVEKQERK